MKKSRKQRIIVNQANKRIRKLNITLFIITLIFIALVTSIYNLKDVNTVNTAKYDEYFTPVTIIIDKDIDKIKKDELYRVNVFNEKNTNYNGRPIYVYGKELYDAKKQDIAIEYFFKSKLLAISILTLLYSLFLINWSIIAISKNKRRTFTNEGRLIFKVSLFIGFFVLLAVCQVAYKFKNISIIDMKQIIAVYSIYAFIYILNILLYTLCEVRFEKKIILQRR